MSAAAQATQKVLPKVLRIGVVQDGKIIKESLIKSGESVSVGSSNKCTFTLQEQRVGAKMDLFVWRGSEYVLSVPEWVEGKISWSDGIRGLDELRGRPEVQKKGELSQIPLNENIRGKVMVGNVTILFQFVPAPPEPIRAVTAADFRPKIWDDEDPLFMGLLSVFSVFALAFVTWVRLSPPPEHSDLEYVDEAAALIVKEIERIEINTPNPDKGDKKTEPDKKENEKPKAENEGVKPAGDPTPKPSAAESLSRKSMLIARLGTTGESAAGRAADVLGDEGVALSNLKGATSGVTSAQQAQAGSLGTRSGSGADGGGVTQVGVGGTGGGSTGTGTGTVTVKKPKVSYAPPEMDVSEGEAGSVKSVVEKSIGRIKSCTERALATNPSLDGRVSVGWQITTGRVSDVHIVNNSTGDSDLGNCIIGAVRGFRFDSTVTATVGEYTFIVSGQ